MDSVAVRMTLKPGQAEDYRRRHDALWPELRDLLKSAGISDYRIFLDPDGTTLFAVLTATDPQALARLPGEPVMRRWWAFMADIMETNPDSSPVARPLVEMFHLP